MNGQINGLKSINGYQASLPQVRVRVELSGWFTSLHNIIERKKNSRIYDDVFNIKNKNDFSTTL